MRRCLMAAFLSAAPSSPLDRHAALPDGRIPQRGSFVAA